MTTESTTRELGVERQMGHVYADITIRNHADAVLAAHGVAHAGAVREIHLERVLVDTGATHLCLPASLIAQLGLPYVRDLAVQTAVGTQPTRVFSDATISIAGRSAEFRCIELPDDAQPLLGVVPMEELGLEPDLKNHVLRVLPEEPGNTHVLLM